MTELASRGEHEGRIAEAAMQVLDEYFGLLKVEMGEAPPVAGIAQAFWDKMRDTMQSRLQPELEATYIAMLDELAQEVSVELSDAAMRAAAWAKDYTFDLVKGITENRQALLQGAIGDFYNQGLTLNDLYARLAPEFGGQRAISIGITETTRAAAEAQRAFTDYLRGQGVPMVDIIVTNNDERVCPICGPKHGKRTSEVGYPPFHVRCRCWFNSVPEADVDEYVRGLP